MKWNSWLSFVTTSQLPSQGVSPSEREKDLRAQAFCYLRNFGRTAELEIGHDAIVGVERLRSPHKEC
jgi:hypothetical protein